MSHETTHKTHEHTTNTITMVVKPPTPPATFDEFTLPKGWAALFIYCPRAQSKDFNGFKKLRE
jgi:hypothetical protein